MLMKWNDELVGVVGYVVFLLCRFLDPPFLSSFPPLNGRAKFWQSKKSEMKRTTTMTKKRSRRTTVLLGPP